MVSQIIYARIFLGDVKMNNKTLDFYDSNIENYSKDTAYVDFHDIQNRFLKYLEKGSSILDMGCGTGRDSKYFLNEGYVVDAMDGSIEMCKFASDFTGIRVEHKLFHELDKVDVYDGIWASASLLHVPYDGLKDVFDKISLALHENGIFYCSFKYGDYQGYRQDRYFTDLNENSLLELVGDHFEIVEQWISEDVRVNQTQIWLNTIMKKI